MAGSSVWPIFVDTTNYYCLIGEKSSNSSKAVKSESLLNC